MAASIHLSDLAYATPEGHSLFSDLSLTFGPVRTGLVGRNGVGKTTLLKLIFGELRPRSGRVTVSGRVAMLRQTLHVDPDAIVADLFEVTNELTLLRRAERGEASVDELNDIDWTLEARIAATLGRLGIDVLPETRLATLSGGQRTRAGLAALLFIEPDFLILDEPTNNLDRDGREAVICLLAGWRSGAIVVSHDRELLDTLDEIVEMTTLGVTRYGGNWTAYREIKSNELAAAERTLADAEKRVTESARTAQQRAERQARRNGAGKRQGLNGGTPRILLGMMKDRAEDTTGGNARLTEKLKEQAFEAAEAAQEKIEILQPFTVRLPPTGLPAGKAVLRVEGLIVGHIPHQPIIRDLTFEITGPEQVAITGANGTGKTTVLSVLTGYLAPWAGTVDVLTPFAMLDQQVSMLDPATSVLDNFKRLNPDTDEQTCRSALAKFLFRADTVHQNVRTLSGGQRLRAGLACVLGVAPPPLLILDEPTNHLDLDSIEAVENGLRAYDGALLVVSHDETFLAAIGITRRIKL